MRGQRTTIAPHFGEKNDAGLVLARLEALERRIVALEGRQSTSFTFAPSPTPARSRPGPKLKLPFYELIRRRDDLYEWAGPCWPELLGSLRTVRTERDVQELWSSFPDIPQGLRFHEDPAQVLSLLASVPGRVKYPRWDWSLSCLANALAGVPEYQWRTSWNLCRRKEPRPSMHPRAWRAHLQRRFPHVLRALANASGDIEKRKILRGGGGKDIILIHLRAMSFDQVRAVLLEGQAVAPTVNGRPPLLASPAADAHRSERYNSHNSFDRQGATPPADLNLRCNCQDCRIEDGREKI